jgi:hypothetical protein
MVINKIKSKFKPKCGLSIGVNTFSASGNQATTPAVSGSFVGAGATLPAFLPKNLADSSSKFSEIEEICLRNNKDAKDLIININGVITIEDGIANEQYEAIRIAYSPLILNLNFLIKIYSFTSGDRVVFAKDSQKSKLANALKSISTPIEIIDLIDFK